MASANFVVVYDACVIYPAPIRDLLMWTALEPPPLFRPCWSEIIHDEWIRNLHARDPVKYPIEGLRRIADTRNTVIPDSIVKDFEELIPSLDLPDLDDRHVLAAAIKAGAQVIVTENLSDFPPDKVSKYNIEAKSADRFILDLS
ncbi:MAG: PIN domain-containing protein [Oligoflexus sp.]|nr:PIN domain-containing protein [Oligoflexus sp.]